MAPRRRLEPKLVVAFVVWAVAASAGLYAVAAHAAHVGRAPGPEAQADRA